MTATTPRRRPPAGRLAAGAALALVAGFVFLLLLAWYRAASPGLGDYLSELGSAGRPSAGAYRLALICVAGAVALASAAGRLGAGPAGAGAALAGSAALFAVSAVVPCAPGCPIPIRDGWGAPANFVHFAASAAGFGAAVLAMARTGQESGDPVLRRGSAAAARVAAFLIVIFAALVLVRGHGVANGVVERILVVTCLAWLVAYAVRVPQQVGRSRRGWS